MNDRLTYDDVLSPKAKLAAARIAEMIFESENQRADIEEEQQKKIVQARDEAKRLLRPGAQEQIQKHSLDQNPDSKANS